MFVLLSVTALRSKNPRQLLYDPKDGHITIKDDHLFIKIPWENFKYLGSWHLFGIPGFKFDYERMVDDWFNVKALFEHYVRKCRPLLVAHFKRLRHAALMRKLPQDDLPTDTKGLFPIPSLTLVDENNFGQIVRELTRRYHVIDPKTGLLRPRAYDGSRTASRSPVRETLAGRLWRSRRTIPAILAERGIETFSLIIHAPRGRRLAITRRASLGGNTR